MMQHLPVLLVIIPLLAAPLCVLLRNTTISRLIATGAVLSATSISAFLMLETAASGPIDYALGGWPAPKGIAYHVDAASSLIAFVVSMVATCSLPIGTWGARDIVRRGRRHYFAAAYLLALTGLLGMTVTGDAFNAFVFLEISSLSSYTLVAMGRSRRAFIASFNYLLLGAIGGTLILLGIGLLYQLTGTLNYIDLSNRLSAIGDARAMRVAFAFICTGLAIKVALFPLYQWLPAAYSEAPAVVSAFLAGSATKVAYFLILLNVYQVFGYDFVFGVLHFGEILVWLSIGAMFFGGIAAIFQTRLKRMLAYSSVSQLGYLTLALSIGSKLAIEAGLLHLVAHAFTKSGLFLAGSALSDGDTDDSLHSLRGRGHTDRFAFGLFVIGGFGLIGVPGTLGFLSKWQLVSAALSAESGWLLVPILLSSLVALVYVWRIVEILYFEKPSEKERPSTDRRHMHAVLAAAAILLGGTIFFGIFGELPLHVSKAAAAVFFR